MIAHTASAAAISGSILRKPFQRSARFEIPALPADSDRSRSSPFSTVTTPDTRLAMASARVTSSGLGTVPDSETTPSRTMMSTPRKAGSSEKMPEIRSAIRSSSPASRVAAIACSGVGVATGSDGASSWAAAGTASSRASRANSRITAPPRTCRRCGRSAHPARAPVPDRSPVRVRGTFPAASRRW